MSRNGSSRTAQIDRRKTPRFEIDGGQICYRIEAEGLRRRLLGWWKKAPDLQWGPVLNLSRGGVRFLSQSLPRANSPVRLRLLLPDHKDRLVLHGVVRGMVVNPGPSYRYQIRVEFSPFQEIAGHRENALKYLNRLVSLEQQVFASA